MALKWSATRYKQKKKTNISRYQTNNLLKTRFLFLVCKKGQKEDTNKFITNSVEINSYDCFHVKISNCSQIASKTFATQCSFTDHLNNKIVNKATHRTPSANPRQLWTH